MTDRPTLTAALLAAVTLCASPAAAHIEPAGDKVKCYGIAKAGQNHCGNAAGTHGCAGQAKVDYDGGEWKLTSQATCTEMGGSLEPFEGVNEKLEQQDG